MEGGGKHPPPQCYNETKKPSAYRVKLKSMSGFETAISWMLETELTNYLGKYSVMMPGDHPAQFYIRQIVYSNSFKHGNTVSADEALDSGNHHLQQNQNDVITLNRTLRETHRSMNISADHCSYSIDYSSALSPSHINSIESLPKNAIQGIVAVIGPLHIALNAQEDIMQVYHKVFKFMYEKIFAGSKLADKPKPWRVSMIFEIVYGGWTLIRLKVLNKFCNCKSVPTACW